MYFLIQVSQDAPNSTVNENFDHLIITSDRVPDCQDVFLSEVIRQHLFNFNRKNIFSPDSFSVYEDTTFYSSAMCESDYYSYSFSCYRYFDQPFEVVEFANSFVSDSLVQFMLHIHLQDVIDHFSFIPSYVISALDVKEMIDDFLCNYNIGSKMDPRTGYQNSQLEDQEITQYPPPTPDFSRSCHPNQPRPRKIGGEGGGIA